jgi:hypothetical protein
MEKLEPLCSVSIAAAMENNIVDHQKNKTKIKTRNYYTTQNFSSGYITKRMKRNQRNVCIPICKATLFIPPKDGRNPSVPRRMNG